MARTTNKQTNGREGDATSRTSARSDRASSGDANSGLTMVSTIGSIDAALARARRSVAAPARGTVRSSAPRVQATPSTFAQDATGDGGGAAAMINARHVLDLRTLYWHNVIREMLNGLSVMCQTQPEVFDGRFAVLTHSDERIAIQTIFPLFACSIPGSSFELEASMALQCSVYRIITPEGEVFTLPLHEIRGLHALTNELVEKLQAAAEAESQEEGGGGSARPFGLAAFTSLTRAQQQEDEGGEGPDEGEESEGGAGLPTALPPGMPTGKPAGRARK